MQTFWVVKKAYKLFSARVGSQLVTSLIILFCWVHNFCTHLPLYWWKSNKIYKQIPKQANNKDIEMAGNSELLTSESMMQHGKETEMTGKCRSVCVSRWTFAASNWRKIWVSNQALLSNSPWWLLLEALSPGLLLEVTCLNLENHFWRPKGLAIKFRKSLEVKNLKFRIF